MGDGQAVVGPGVVAGKHRVVLAKLLQPFITSGIRCTVENILISSLQIDSSHHTAKTEEPVFPCKEYGKRLTVLKELEYSSHEE